jgi:hypothetical protein
VPEADFRQRGGSLQHRSVLLAAAESLPCSDDSLLAEQRRSPAVHEHGFWLTGTASCLAAGTRLLQLRWFGAPGLGLGRRTRAHRLPQHTRSQATRPPQRTMTAIIRAWMSKTCWTVK